MAPLFPWDAEARRDTIARTKEVIQAIEKTLATTDPDLRPYREGLSREKDSAAAYLEALEAADQDSP